MFHREALVVDSEVVQHGRVEVIDVHRILYDVVRVIVGFPVIETGFESSSGNPGREASAMMITPVIVFR